MRENRTRNAVVRKHFLTWRVYLSLAVGLVPLLDLEGKDRLTVAERFWNCEEEYFRDWVTAELIGPLIIKANILTRLYGPVPGAHWTAAQSSRETLAAIPRLPPIRRYPNA